MIPMIDETHDPALESWVAGANGHAEFPVQNLPYGVFSTARHAARIGVAVGDKVLDVKAAAEAGLLPKWAAAPLGQRRLNEVMALSQAERVDLRRNLSRLLSDKAFRLKVEPLLYDTGDCVLHLPAAIGDYTDFYVGIHHATNVGRLFRPDNPLMPNYKYVPIGYHGRASSIRPSGVPVIRPQGQSKAPDAQAPTFGPSRRLDYELELGVWIGPGNPLGHPIEIAEAPRHVAGFCLLNDWSARDLQAWEYQPLGPFLSKNFQTTISPWVVTAEAMTPFRLAQPARPEGDPRPLDYLWDPDDQDHGALSVTLEVSLLTVKMRAAGASPALLSRGPASNMYWTVAQMIVHHTVGGCNLSPGDLLGTGTISAPDKDGFGSLLEITQGGGEPLSLPNGETRAFLEDGDEVIFRGVAQTEGRVSIGFGPCRAHVLPAA
jgi:fumarylacetoacetase